MRVDFRSAANTEADRFRRAPRNTINWAGTGILLALGLIFLVISIFG